jgi:RNA polymerase sigma factor (sigma-70 family)
MRKQTNDNGDDGGFFDCLTKVLNHLEPIDVLFEHPDFKALLSRICFAVTPNAADAEDLYMDACIKLIRIIDKYDPAKGSFAGWLRTIVQNLNTDRFRRKTFDLDETPSDERYDLKDSGPDAFDQLWEREFKEMVNELAAKQNDRDRLILTIFFQGFSCRAIPKILKQQHRISTTHVTVGKVLKKLLGDCWKTKVLIPDVDRKANKLTQRPVVKAELNRKAEKISKRRVRNRRHALKR